MRLLKSILTGILLYVLIFVEISITQIALNLDSIAVWIIHYFALILFVMLCSFIYFRKSRGGAGQGLLLGLIYLIVGIILDSLITVPFFVVSEYSTLGEAFIGYFGNPHLLIGFLELLVFTIIFGLVFKRKEIIIIREMKKPVPQINKSKALVEEKEETPFTPRTLDELKEEIISPLKPVYKTATIVSPVPSGAVRLKLQKKEEKKKAKTRKAKKKKTKKKKK